MLTGLDIEAKAALVREQMDEAFGRAKSRPDQVTWELARTDRADADTEETASALLRLVVRDGDADAVGRTLSSAAIELALGSYPGFHVTAPPGKGAPYGVFEAAYVDRAEVEHVAVLPDGERKVITYGGATRALADMAAPPLPAPLPPGPTRRAPSASSRAPAAATRAGTRMWGSGWAETGSAAGTEAATGTAPAMGAGPARGTGPGGGSSMN